MLGKDFQAGNRLGVPMAMGLVLERRGYVGAGVSLRPRAGGTRADTRQSGQTVRCARILTRFPRQRDNNASGASRCSRAEPSFASRGCLVLWRIPSHNRPQSARRRLQIRLRPVRLPRARRPRSRVRHRVPPRPNLQAPCRRVSFFFRSSPQLLRQTIGLRPYETHPSTFSVSSRMGWKSNGFRKLSLPPA